MVKLFPSNFLCKVSCKAAKYFTQRCKGSVRRKEVTIANHRGFRLLFILQFSHPAYLLPFFRFCFVMLFYIGCFPQCRCRHFYKFSFKIIDEHFYKLAVIKRIDIGSKLHFFGRDDPHQQFVPPYFRPEKSFLILVFKVTGKLSFGLNGPFLYNVIFNAPSYFQKQCTGMVCNNF